MKTIQLFFISFLVCNLTFAQVVPPQDDSKIEEKIENIANTADESADLTELTEQLQQLAANPINLNKATREDLLQTGLFSEVQADAIIEHREISGKFISLYELQSIDYLSLEDIEEILPYVTVGNTEDIKATLKKIFSDGNSRLIVRGQRYL
ncbi:MAG TPA: helix-hairpin-helix domain-containing protein, partial [Bacteroidia bacterium]|nr:helix-hairpin-helix domain-containing protein [Bacteroidia bacterium]